MTKRKPQKTNDRKRLHKERIAAHKARQEQINQVAQAAITQAALLTRWEMGNNWEMGNGDDDTSGKVANGRS